MGRQGRLAYHSGSGHTKLQAEAVHRGAAGVEGIDAEIITATEAIERLDEFDSVDAIICGCPTYAFERVCLASGEAGNLWTTIPPQKRDCFRWRLLSISAAL
jgi:hypothetical protein